MIVLLYAIIVFNFVVLMFLFRELCSLRGYGIKDNNFTCEYAEADRGQLQSNLLDVDKFANKP